MRSRSDASARRPWLRDELTISAASAGDREQRLLDVQAEVTSMRIGIGTGIASTNRVSDS